MAGGIDEMAKLGIRKGLLCESRSRVGEMSLLGTRRDVEKQT